MFRHVFIILLITHTGYAIRAQDTLSSNQIAMQKAVIGFFDALANLDAVKAKSFCTTDITILESGRVWNMDSLVLRITTRKTKTASFKRINKFDFFETKSAGDVGWISYFNEAEIILEEKSTNIKWLESVVLKKYNGKWKICLLHSTKLEPEP